MRIVVVAALAVGCARATIPAPTIATQPAAIAGTELCVDLPASLAARPLTNEHGYVDVLFGDPGHDSCAVGLEVYLPAATDRPPTLTALEQIVATDHAAPYELTAAPTTVEHLGRPTISASWRNPTNGVKERQWAFFLAGDPLVASFYTTGALPDCEAVEQAVLSTIRKAPCPTRQ